jgi:hypothetical protein
MLPRLMRRRRMCLKYVFSDREFCGRREHLMNSADNCIQEDDKPFQVKLSDESFETYELDPPPYTLDTTKKELKKMYYDMVSIRSVDK